eukprot:scaffold96938_cov60-Attheya_sp.AAC.1
MESEDSGFQLEGNPTSPLFELAPTYRYQKVRIATWKSTVLVPTVVCVAYVLIACHKKHHGTHAPSRRVSFCICMEIEDSSHFDPMVGVDVRERANRIIAPLSWNRIIIIGHSWIVRGSLPTSTVIA